jgi:hypothetical protein
VLGQLVLGLCCGFVAACVVCVALPLQCSGWLFYSAAAAALCFKVIFTAGPNFVAAGTNKTCLICVLMCRALHVQQEEIEREETLADLEGGQVQEEGLEDLIAALRQRNNAAAAASQQQQQRQAAAADDSGLFWDYSGNSSSSSRVQPPPVPQQQQPVPMPRAALVNAAAAAQPRAAAPQAIAPPVVAGPWARAATSGAIKAPPPGSASNPQQQQQRSAAAVVAAGGRSGTVKSSVPGAVYASESSSSAAATSRRPTAAASNGSSSMAGFDGSSSVDNSLGLLPGGLQLSPAFAEWCRGQMLLLNGNDDMDMIEVLMGLTSNSEIAECCQDVWQGKPGESIDALFCLCCACWCWLWVIWLS